jgi:hypothetical protein
MSNPRKFLTFIVFSLLSIGLNAQENKSNQLSYSFSYITPYLFLGEGDIEFIPTWLNFEANIHYKPFDVISFTSGIFFLRDTETVPSSYIETMIENNRSYRAAESLLRIPLQVNYHLVKAPEKTDSYIKAVYTNGFGFAKDIKYESDGTTTTSRSTSYLPSVGLGIGAIFLKHKKVGILLEGTFEKFLRFGDFTEKTLFSLKIGVII